MRLYAVYKVFIDNRYQFNTIFCGVEQYCFFSRHVSRRLRSKRRGLGLWMHNFPCKSVRKLQINSQAVIFHIPSAVSQPFFPSYWKVLIYLKSIQALKRLGYTKQSHMPSSWLKGSPRTISLLYTEYKLGNDMQSLLCISGEVRYMESCVNEWRSFAEHQWQISFQYQLGL